MSQALWQDCLKRLESELSDEELNSWIRPLQAHEGNGGVQLFAPNELIAEHVSYKYLERIREHASGAAGGNKVPVMLEVGDSAPAPAGARRARDKPNVDPNYTFENFVEGKSNRIARAAGEQVASHPSASYNPLTIYGGVGLGKTHLMHAIGNAIVARNPKAKILYMQSERFVNDMITALRHHRMDEFKQRYRSVDALLIDDIQFFANKSGSQEEFFHTFNALHEAKQQIILTCDRYPKEVEGLEERLKSRFSWGLSVAIEPPELETRVAILVHKAELAGVDLDQEVAFFVAGRVRSHVRDLESALHRLAAHAGFTGEKIDVEFAKRVLHDMLAVHDRSVTLENIQRTVAGYYKIRVSDLLSSRRNRSLARPRQIAMTLAKELTNHSYPEIGEAFGGRDHTTVLHACRRVADLKETDSRVNEDYANLRRSLNQ